MVAAEVFSALQSVAAWAFAAHELVLGLALHRLFADQAPTPVEGRMTAARAEGVARVLYWGLELRATLRVAAEMPQRLFELGQNCAARSRQTSPLNGTA